MRIAAGIRDDWQIDWIARERDENVSGFHNCAINIARGSCYLLSPTQHLLSHLPKVIFLPNTLLEKAQTLLGLQWEVVHLHE